MSSSRRIANIPSPPIPRFDPGIVEGSIVEIRGGAFRGQAARVTRVTESKEEVTVELFKAKVPVALTVRADQVELALESNALVRIDTRHYPSLEGRLVAGRIGRVYEVDEGAKEVKVRVYDSDILKLVNYRRSAWSELDWFEIVVRREDVTITRSLAKKRVEEKKEEAREIRANQKRIHQYLNEGDEEE